MLDSLIRWSLHNRVVVLAAAAGFLVWGGNAATRVPVDVLPDVTAPTVTVLVEGHGMAPTDMEALVTFPIESSLNGASGVRRVRSATAVGIAVIWADFEWGEDIFRARQTVTEKLAAVSATLPDAVDPPGRELVHELVRNPFDGGKGRAIVNVRDLLGQLAAKKAEVRHTLLADNVQVGTPAALGDASEMALGGAKDARVVAAAQAAVGG